MAATIAETSAAPSACALCGASEVSGGSAIGGAWIVRCARCGLVRQAEASSGPELYDAAYYTSGRTKGGYANYFRDAAINRRTFAARLARITQRLGRKGRLLDVGCALGDFVLEALQQGWDAQGLEASVFAAEEARRLGAPVHLGTIGSARLPASSFDAVTFYDTIEHVSDPLEMLTDASRLLVPGGLMHIVTPNVDGIQARLFGGRWYHYKPGEHLVYFGPRTLERAIVAAGMTWEGWARTGSYVTVSYVLDRLRAYSPAFGRLASAGQALGLGSFTFYLYVGEMECWARRSA